MDELTAAAKPAKVPKLPSGYEDLDMFMVEARERFRQGEESDRENREAGMDDLRFTAGDQWDEKVKATRLSKGRPCLTINTLPQYVGQVIGDTRANRPSIKVRPTEDSDGEAAELRQGLIRFIENNSNANQVYALAGEDQVTCGLGHFRVGLKYSDDDAFDQDIKIDHIANPFSVVWDAESVEPTGADAKFCFVVDTMNRKAFEKAYPDKGASDLEVPNTQARGWITQDLVRVVEYWLIKTTKRKLALIQQAPDADPKIVDITDNEADMLPFVVTGSDGQPRVREKEVKSACMYLINGVDILAGPYEYKIKRVPIFKVSGREVRVGERRYRFGLVRFAKDAVRIKNLTRSSAMEWVVKAPRAQWLIHASDEAEANRLRKSSNSDDPVIVYSGQNPPQRVDPASAPAALLQEAQFCDQDIKDVTGLHDASLGMKSNETSGKAILARERQGDTATFMYHDNLAASIREAGRVINDLLPVIYDTPRTITTLGDDDVAKPQRINDPNHAKSIDLKDGKFDVVVETGPSYATKRVEAAESMMQFVQAVPGAGEVAGDLIAKAQDWPMADEISDRLKKRLPPGLVEEDDSDLSPEEKAAKDQARAAADAEQAEVKAMQKRAAELDLDQKQATVLKTDAEAKKIGAEARGAGKPEGKAPLEDAQALLTTRKMEAEAEKAEGEAKSAKIKAELDEFQLRVALAGNPNAAAEIEPDAGDTDAAAPTKEPQPA